MVPRFGVKKWRGLRRRVDEIRSRKTAQRRGVTGIDRLAAATASSTRELRRRTTSKASAATLADSAEQETRQSAEVQHQTKTLPKSEKSEC
eukprot:562082-Pleurochrysis_carterae.AAC.2